tara:strand:- start:419 stop:727 length:309 start_codon:yes stop_codon:yes gene_type:complete
MNTFFITATQQYSENTPEYGHCDYPAQLHYIVCVVDADTRRKAQNAAKKLFPGLRFGGQFGDGIYKTDDEFAYLYTKAADDRLTVKAKNLHNAALIKLNGMI